MQPFCSLDGIGGRLWRLDRADGEKNRLAEEEEARDLTAGEYEDEEEAGELEIAPLRESRARALNAIV